MMKKVHYAPPVQLESISIWNTMEMELRCAQIAQFRIAMNVTQLIHANLVFLDLHGLGKLFLLQQLLNALPAKIFIVNPVQMKLLNVINVILIVTFFQLRAQLRQIVFHAQLKSPIVKLAQMIKPA